MTPRGFRYDEERKRAAGGPSEQIEQEIGRYLDADLFRTAYPAAHAKWNEAAALIWRSDSQSQLTTIGRPVRSFDLRTRLGARAYDRDRFEAFGDIVVPCAT